MNKNQIVIRNVKGGIKYPEPKIYYTKDIVEQLVYHESEKDKKHNFGLANRGQIKLLMSEIRFLTSGVKIHKHPKTKYILIYIGSGPGHHVPYLYDFYKKYDIEWHLFDPRGHCTELYTIAEDNKITLHDEIFSERSVELFNKTTRTILFISDIRTVEEDMPGNKEIINDNKLQNNILKLLKPTYSLLKFRYPFPIKDGITSEEDIFELPIGEEQLQAYSKQGSTEFRIFLGPNLLFKKIKTQDEWREYEEKFMWYNTMFRFSHKNDIIMSRHIFEEYYRAEKNYNNTGVVVWNLLKDIDISIRNNVSKIS